ncbi:hypothetical protein ES705_26281 [subsurface metagenome]
MLRKSLKTFLSGKREVEHKYYFFFKIGAGRRPIS